LSDLEAKSVGVVKRGLFCISNIYPHVIHINKMERVCMSTRFWRDNFYGLVRFNGHIEISFYSPEEAMITLKRGNWKENLPTFSKHVSYPSIMAKSKSKQASLEIVEPIGERVLIRKDEDRKITKVGIHLPDKIEIPTITGRIVAVSTVIENNPDYPIQQYDKILFNPKNSIPVDFEGDNRLFVIPLEDVVAIFRRDT